MRACRSLFFAAAALVYAVSADCDACIDRRCYRKHRLPLPVSGDFFGFLMDIDRNKNIMYIRHDGELKQCQLDTAICNGTGNTWDIDEFTVDPRTGDAYILIHKDPTIDVPSIFKLDLVNNERKLLVQGAVSITFKDKLYYTTLHNGIYTLVDGASRIVAGTEAYSVNEFFVDRKDDIYFSTRLNDNNVIRRLSNGVVDGNVYWTYDSFRITVDRDGNVVFIDPESHAVYRVTNGRQVEVGVCDDSIKRSSRHNELFFDRDNNLIYKNDTFGYFYLKQDRYIHCTTSIIEEKRIINEIFTQEHSEHH